MKLPDLKKDEAAIKVTFFGLACLSLLQEPQDNLQEKESLTGENRQ